MIRTKVVNDSTDLIPLMRAFDSSVKQEVFREIQSDWRPLSEIKEKYGSSGQQALELFDQMKRLKRENQLHPLRKLFSVDPDVPEFTAELQRHETSLQPLGRTPIPLVEVKQ